jgi:hypothetical protein
MILSFRGTACPADCGKEADWIRYNVAFLYRAFFFMAA